MFLNRMLLHACRACDGLAWAESTVAAPQSKMPGVQQHMQLAWGLLSIATNLILRCLIVAAASLALADAQGEYSCITALATASDHQMRACAARGRITTARASSFDSRRFSAAAAALVLAVAV